MSDSFATPWTVARKAPLSVGFPCTEYWRGLPFPLPGCLPDPGIKPTSPALAGRFFITEPLVSVILFFSYFVFVPAWNCLDLWYGRVFQGKRHFYWEDSKVAVQGGLSFWRLPWSREDLDFGVWMEIVIELWVNGGFLICHSIRMCVCVFVCWVSPSV